MGLSDFSQKQDYLLNFIENIHEHLRIMRINICYIVLIVMLN